jgi:hypothetical protein
MEGLHGAAALPLVTDDSAHFVPTSRMLSRWSSSSMSAMSKGRSSE